MPVKTKFLYSIIFAILSILVIAACTPNEDESNLQADFEVIRADYRNWTALQAAPMNISAMIFTLCRLPSDSEMAFAESEEHGNYYLRDFMNSLGFEALTSQAETFPVGTIIVKEKFREASETWDNPVALGLMIKHDEGFNPSSNDWEFMYYDDEGTLWQGIETTTSCQACHAEAERDFVFEER